VPIELRATFPWAGGVTAELLRDGVVVSKTEIDEHELKWSPLQYELTRMVWQRAIDAVSDPTARAEIQLEMDD